MKLIKLLVTMTILNALIVSGLVQYVSLSPTPIVVQQDIIHLASPVATKSTKLTNQSPVPKTESKTETTVVPTKTPTPRLTAPPTVVVATATPVPKPTGCVIQLDGIKYEISSLQKTHSGGNVFTCGTDMSAIFWSRHNNRILQMMQQYRI